MRVYLPATMPLLASLERERRLQAADGYAVTASLREWFGEGDDEELEFEALNAAARASLRLLAEASGTPTRRVVVAADVPDARVSEPGGSADPGVIKVTGGIRLADVAALHVDEASAQPAVAAAIGALDAADKGDAEAEAVIAAAEDHDLLWYVTQELGDLV